MRQRGKQRDASGQAMVEFALVAPVFFLLVFGVIQLGLLFSEQNGLVNGVRDAARRAATYRLNDISLQDATTKTAVCSALTTELNAKLQKELPGFSVTRLTGTIADTATPPAMHIFAYEWKSTPNDATKYYVVARVGVKYRHPLYLPIVGGILDGIDGVSDNSLALTASEEMRIENPTNLGVPAASTYYC